MGDGPFLLKDFFNPDTIGIVADAIAEAHPEFDRRRFLQAIFDESWQDRELKQRMRHAATVLRDFLPDDYEEALEIVRRASPATESAGFAAMVLSDFVEAFGIHHLEHSLAALRNLTMVVSAEFAVRPFLDRYPEETLACLRGWANDTDWRVRRLASEGSRPRLPWGMALKRLQADPSPIIPILAALRHDESADVRRSVANSLNDISKDHQDLVVDLLTEWQDGTQSISEITKHALRTLLKQGHPRALDLLGYQPGADVVIEDLAIEPDPVAIGQKTTVTFRVRSTGTTAQPIMVDGVVTYARPKGTASKVFKWKTLELAPGEAVLVRRSLSLQQMSTRRIHPGRHSVEIQVNGARLARATFSVEDPISP